MLLSSSLPPFRCTIAALAVALLASGPAVQAQPADVPVPARESAEPRESADIDQARELFLEGVDLATSRRFADAARTFRSALQLHQAPSIRYNLARALAETGELAEAYDLAVAVVEEAGVEASLRQSARALQDQLQQRVARLRVRLGGETDGVRLNGRDVTPASLESPLTLGPGEYVVEGMRDGEVMTRRAVSLEPGTHALIDVSVIPSPREAAASAPAPDPGAPSDSPKRSGWIVGVAVGAAVVLATVIAVVLLTRRDEETERVEGNFSPGVLEW